MAVRVRRTDRRRHRRHAPGHNTVDRNPSPEHRSDSTWRSAFSAYRLLLVDPMFIGLSFIGALGISSFFIYIGSASFVFINHYALSPTLFSLCFALNAASFFAFSQMTARLTARFGLAPVIRFAVSGFAGVTAILAVQMTLGPIACH
jgi:DHA1 family bicyclomycin/chloramphenicol resistance-like MFS transporter